IPDTLMLAYSMSGAVPVSPDVELLRALGHCPVMRELLGSGPKIRHDPHKLAGAILELAGEAQLDGRVASSLRTPVGITS
ncbi:MAG TPA: hypothetical protein VJ259_01760, partial [Actinomycetota bacterium]|nr:hypothetical protein [Actinomycetota bacterium]